MSHHFSSKWSGARKVRGLMKKNKALIVFSLLSMVLALPLESFASIKNAKSIRDFSDESDYYDIETSDEASQFFLEDFNDDVMEISFGVSKPDVMPVDGIITSKFGWRRLSFGRGRRARRASGRMHAGIDIAAPVGTPIFAPADGEVVFSGRKGGYGLAVVISHGGNLTTLYGHNSQVFVSEGQKIKKGEKISQVGSTGHSTGPHLHYEVRVADVPVNPSRFF